MQTTPLSNKANQCTPSHPREVDNGVSRTSGGGEGGDSWNSSSAQFYAMQTTVPSNLQKNYALTKPSRKEKERGRRRDDKWLRRSQNIPACGWIIPRHCLTQLCCIVDPICTIIE